MDSDLLTRLARAGVLERAGPGRTVLRVAPRFLAHAEGTAHRLHCRDARDALHAALQDWAPYTAGPRGGAAVLVELMKERDQMGALGVLAAA